MEFEKFVEVVYRELENSAILYSLKNADQVRKELEGSLRKYYRSMGLEKLEANSPEVLNYAEVYRKGFVHGVSRTKDHGLK